MRFTPKNLVFALVTLTAATSFAERARAFVPFNFVAGKQMFPSGYYDVTLDPSHSFIRLVSEANSTTVVTSAAEPADRANADIVLRFNVVGANHCLKTVQTGVRVSPSLTNCGKLASQESTVVGN
jgi:hypothetical protein